MLFLLAFHLPFVSSGLAAVQADVILRPPANAQRGDRPAAAATAARDWNKTADAFRVVGVVGVVRVVDCGSCRRGWWGW